MKTDLLYEPNKTVFLQTVSGAIGQLKQRLRQQYEQGYPDLHELIALVLDEEEARAWELTLFPHLLFPDMVEAHLASLNLHPVRTRHHARKRHEFRTYQAAFATCA